MSATEEYDSSYPPPAPGLDETVSGWVGWIYFASVLIIIVGGLNVIQGLAALLRDETYWVTLGGSVVTFDITSWGWIHLIFGIVLVLVGIALMQGSTFARVVGVVLVSLNLIAQFSYATLYPFWAIIAVGIDVLIIYALLVHGRELKA